MFWGISVRFETHDGVKIQKTRKTANARGAPRGSRGRACALRPLGSSTTSVVTRVCPPSLAPGPLRLPRARVRPHHP